jgi:hypothetical protein
MSNVYCSTKCRTQCSTTTSLTFVTQIPEEAPAVSETYLVQLNVDDRNAKKKKLNHRVHWSKDTKDNEFLNRKKSKSKDNEECFFFVVTISSCFSFKFVVFIVNLAAFKNPLHMKTHPIQVIV